MTIHIDGEGIRIVIAWRSVKAAIQAIHTMLKVLLPVITALASLFAAPEVMRLMKLLGWW
jgi:hypothetical protein